MLGFAEVGAGVRVVVQERDGPSGDAANRVLLGSESAEHSGAALGCFEHQQNRPGVIAGPSGHRLDREFVALKLKLGLHSPFQRVHGRHALLGRDVRGELDQQRVAVVLNVGHDALDPLIRAFGNEGAVGRREIGGPGPSSVEGVKQGSLLVFVVAAAQADVHPPDECGVAVAQLGEQVPVRVFQFALQFAGPFTVRLEPDRRSDFMSARWRSSSSALMRSRRRVLTARSFIVGSLSAGRLAAVLADLVAGRRVAVVQVSAGLAALDLSDVDAGAVVAGREADPVDLVAGAFVVDERAGAEFADGEERGR